MTHSIDSGTVFVAGVNGVGKTTVLSDVCSRSGRDLIKGSSFFMRWLGLSDGDYARLIALPDELKNKEQTRVMIHIATCMNQQRVGLLDAHLLNISKGNIADATGDWMSLFRGICVVTAPTNEVLARIEGDSQTGVRQRNLFPDGLSKTKKIEMLEEYLSRTLAQGTLVSEKYGLPLLVVSNNDGCREACVMEICSWVGELPEKRNN